jgi:hypothetical protein
MINTRVRRRDKQEQKRGKGKPNEEKKRKRYTKHNPNTNVPPVALKNKTSVSWSPDEYSAHCGRASLIVQKRERKAEPNKILAHLLHRQSR